MTISTYHCDPCFTLPALYISASVSTGNTFQDLPRLRETADNIERDI
jgi:hypothetical protein